MEIHKYADEFHRNTLCLKRTTHELSGFKSGNRYQVTRYVYVDRVEISAIRVYPSGHFDQAMRRTFPRVEYIPGPTSNEHFPGDCFISHHENDGKKFTVVHRTRREAERFCDGRADLFLI